MGVIEQICSDSQVLCLIIRAELNPSETKFLTPPEFNLQVGYIVYSAGHQIPRHVHREIHRDVGGTSEVLVVRRGRCLIDVYNEERHLIATRELHAGDIMIMVAGGHGFRMLEDTVLLEVKQGPYPGVDEKERF